MIKSKFFYPVLLSFFLLPLLWVDINTFHNWGDDFAQYLCNARQMIRGGDLKMYHNQAVAPLHRGAGFSLLLGVWMTFFDLQLPAYFVLMSFCLIFCAFVLFRFFQKYLPFESNHLTVLTMVLLFVYNRHVLFLKTEILPVFLIIALSYACLLLYKNVSIKFNPIAVLCLGFLLSLANVAWSIYFALFFFHLYLIWKQIEKFVWQKSALQFATPLIVFIGIKFLVFKTFFTDEVSWYAPVFNWHGLTALIKQNLVFYKDIFFVTFDHDIWFGFNKGIKFSLLCLMFAGLIGKWRKAFAAEDLFFIFYFLLLLVYPDHGGGIRLLLPLLPMFFLYAAHACFQIINGLRLNSSIAVLFFLPLFLAQVQTLPANISQNAQMYEGPNSAPATACFQFIHDSTEKNAAVAFVKPWALMLYAKRSVMPFPNTQSLPDLKSLMLSNHVPYVLFDTQSKLPEMQNAQAYHDMASDTAFKCVYQKQGYAIFRLVSGL